MNLILRPDSSFNTNNNTAKLAANTKIVQIIHFYLLGRCKTHFYQFHLGTLMMLLELTHVRIKHKLDLAARSAMYY
jgi:hypothetical protein